ncbi:hypothetical protein [Massilia antarctica]|uniref:hypothetical protein n=1 Tax=Massilia antarctica TaxID=2765360 RepID=UPI0011AF3DF9|nr:hypothetical protein [Massilia sp. H27-R4]MCY0916266.1 hypothetical protein [Massilia sp. H27-R4]
MNWASWRNGAAIAALAGAAMVVTAWLAAPSDEPDAPLSESHARQGAAPTPSFGVASAAAEPGDPSGRWVGSMDLGGGRQAQSGAPRPHHKEVPTWHTPVALVGHHRVVVADTQPSFLPIAGTTGWIRGRRPRHYAREPGQKHGRYGRIPLLFFTCYRDWIPY